MRKTTINLSQDSRWLGQDANQTSTELKSTPTRPDGNLLIWAIYTEIKINCSYKIPDATTKFLSVREIRSPGLKTTVFWILLWPLKFVHDVVGLPTLYTKKAEALTAILANLGGVLVTMRNYPNSFQMVTSVFRTTSSINWTPTTIMPGSSTKCHVLHPNQTRFAHHPNPRHQLTSIRCKQILQGLYLSPEHDAPSPTRRIIILQDNIRYVRVQRSNLMRKYSPRGEAASVAEIIRHNAMKSYGRVEV
jgi:hypothetical protein